MLRKLTIFQKLFFTYLLLGVLVVLLTAVNQYQSSFLTVRKDLKNQTIFLFNKASEYFNEFYSQSIHDDLELITSTPLLDNFLMSENSEVYLTQPNVEKLFLHFTKRTGSKYLSIRFINSRGKEEVVSEGNVRAHQYASLLSRPAGEFYDRMFKLFNRLRTVPLDREHDALFEGPFLFNGKMTFLVGVAKLDPEGGGFGGAVIMHCDLTSYFKYLSQIKYRGLSVVSAFSPDGQTLLYPLGPGEPVLPKSPQEAWISFEEAVKLTPDQGELLKLRMMIPRVFFINELKDTLFNSFLIQLLILTFIGISAYFVSKNITRPIKRLVETTKRISAGDLTIKAKVDSQDEIGQLSKSFNEMIANLKEFEERLQYEAFHDVLTGLPNRALLLDRLERMIERNRRHLEHKFAVLFVDLDRFKNVNDSLGHTKGDELLVAISHRLRRCLRTMDTVARLGGDEFIILMDEINDVDDATHLATRILKELEPLFNIDGQEIYISASIGVALSNPRCTQPADYLRDTDIAMYRAKSLGKSRYQVFDAAMHSTAVASLQMEAELRSAIERNEFVVYYQPIVSLRSRKIVRLEALIRWQHPRRGLVPPAEFIPLAEETGLIFQIGHWVMTTVCRQIKLWQQSGRHVVPVAFNFSAKQFEQKDLVYTIKEILKETGIAGEMLTIEITESVAMHAVSLTIALLNELRGLGIKVAIDDFGVGYSSLSSLKLFPIDELKIDRSFIHDVVENPDKAAIAKAIIVMAHSLGYVVIGEGIETRAQLDFLIKNGCDEGQGVLFEMAMPSDEIKERLGRDAPAA